ncbi:hypothetical protein [Paraburkholderia sp.]|uniref:hypothetical protein n=1 Tax=Paraburkholderia sp. TaxID=1926495 RepID=UPI0023880F2B|nr:hypothetical protein [Paraburkholderia sp.]MDE1181767.1 hypothetical protein [Paraburkholderia sp.]
MKLSIYLAGAVLTLGIAAHAVAQTSQTYTFGEGQSTPQQAHPRPVAGDPPPDHKPAPKPKHKKKHHVPPHHNNAHNMPNNDTYTHP